MTFNWRYDQTRTFDGRCIYKAWLGWILGIGIGKLFYNCDFYISNDLVSNADSGDIKIMVQFPGNPILKFFLQFSNCVGVSFSKLTNVYILLREAFWYIKSTILIWFCLTVNSVFTQSLQFINSLYSLKCKNLGFYLSTF